MKSSFLILLGLFTLSAQGQIVTGSGIAQSLDVHPWRMDHANPARTGKSSYPGALIGEVEWARKIGGSVTGIASDRQGKAILGATFYDQLWSNELYVQAYERDGTISWRKKVEPYPWGASQGVKSAPALSKSGEAVLNSGNGQILRFDRAGLLLQTMPCNPNATNDRAPALLDDGSLLHQQFISMYKFRADGSLQWSTSASTQTDLAVAPNGDIAMGGVRTNEPHGSLDLSYYNKNGTLLWTKSSSRGSRTQVCFGPDGTLYAGFGGTTAFHPDGTVKWTATNGGWGVCLDGLGRALVPQSRTVFAYNKDTGSLLWSTTLPFIGNIVEGLSIDSANRIYMSSTDGFVACLDKNGTLLWNIKVCDTFVTQPSIAASSAIYLSGYSWYRQNFLYRIR